MHKTVVFYCPKQCAYEDIVFFEVEKMENEEIMAPDYVQELVELIRTRRALPGFPAIGGGG